MEETFEKLRKTITGLSALRTVLDEALNMKDLAHSWSTTGGIECSEPNGCTSDGSRMHSLNTPPCPRLLILQQCGGRRQGVQPRL